MNRTQVPTRRNGAFDEFSGDVERMFDSLLGRTFGTMLRNNASERFVPTLDVAETADAFEVAVDLPGVTPDQVKLELHNDQLIISGKRDNSTERKDKNYHFVERSSGSFMRTIQLPSDVDADKIDARYEHGVLHVKLPKSAKLQPKKIEIRTGN
ncbi:MAG: Hsp20/alpha crystallin family protein [Pirellulales bacterium]